MPHHTAWRWGRETREQQLTYKKINSELCYRTMNFHETIFVGDDQRPGDDEFFMILGSEVLMFLDSLFESFLSRKVELDKVDWDPTGHSQLLSI